MVLLALVPALGVPAIAHASIGGDGSTRDGARPIVRMVASGQERLKRPPLLQRGTFAYGSDLAQRFDAYWPDARSGGKLPGVLLLHGGYWFGGDKTNWRGAAKRLAARGYAVFSANYRLTTQAAWPAQRDDAAAALRYIQRHAERFRLDPNRMVVVGSSAGGHLATVLGATGTSGIRGAVALSPVNYPYLAYVDGGHLDANGPQRKLRRAVTQLVRCRPTDLTSLAATACLERMAQATPQITAAAVPMLFVHSRGDFVPVTQSNPLRDALAAAGGSADVKLIPGSSHGGDLLRIRRIYKMVVAWIDAVTRTPSAR